MGKVFYIVATTRRSGSGFLRDNLKAAGCGDPKEHTNDAARAKTKTVWSRIRAEQADMECIGTKLMWIQVTRILQLIDHNDHAKWLDDLVLQAESEDYTVKFIYLSRQNVFAQAISEARAQQGGKWNSKSGHGVEHIEVQYKRNHLIKRVDWLLEQDKLWEAYFVTRNIDPFRVEYEDLTTVPGAVTTAITQFLGHGKYVVPDDARVKLNTDNEHLIPRLAKDYLARKFKEATVADAKG